MNQPSIWGANRNLRPVNQAVRSSLGVQRHPRVSIEGGSFHLEDANANRWPAAVIPHPGKQGVWAFLCIVVGANPHKSKIYYPFGYDPSNPMPPLCFSDNGQSPSNSAQEPQAAFCAECEFSKWGSKQSQQTGRDIKACGDKKKIAVLPLGDTTGMAYELQVPPASLGALSAYSDFVAAIPFPTGERQTDISDVVTMISFEQGKTGYLAFDWAGWIDSVAKDESGALQFCYNQDGPYPSPDGGWHACQLIDHIWDSNVVETLVGSNDQPFVAPAGWRGAGRAQIGSQAPLAGMGARLPTPAQSMQGGAQPRPTAPAGPYSPPPGATIARSPAPTFRVPQSAGPEGGGQPPGPGVPANVPTRGGARAGAGRKPRTVAPAPSQALHPQPGNVVAHPAAMPRQEPEAIPPFLNRAGPAWSGQGSAAQGGPGQPQTGGNGSFASNAGAPPASLKAALDNAMNMKTEG